MPKKVKHRKWQKGRSRKREVSKGGTELSFGSYGIKAATPAWITSRQIESARRAMTRYIQRGGKIWIRIFPDKPITRKGAEMPMGKGKGSVDHFVFKCKPGRVIFEIDGVDREVAEEAMRLASYKLPVKTKFISNE